jgi:hypothetical protein
MGYFFKVVLVFVVLNTQIEGRYERHSQFCGGMNGSDMKWSLDVKKNKTYTLEITKRKNEYLSKSQNVFIMGLWRIEGDTLKLYQLGKEDSAFVFCKKEDKLILVNNKYKTENELFFLDYLEKTKK